jgi:peptidoglycan/xylan/chitin deacetylase (PgdA/CDA1 family)
MISGEREDMKSKRVAVLAVILILLFSATFMVDFDNTFFAGLFAPSIPEQIYEPAVPASNQKVVCIVFDDGWKSQLDAVPILQSYGFNATFAIVTSYTSYPDYMNWKDIAGLASDGMDIASHTATHCNLSKVDSATLYNEVFKSQQILRTKGYPANVLVYPYGGASDNETVRDVVAQCYLAARGTVEGKCNLTVCNRYNLPSYDVYHDVSLEDYADYLNGTGGSVVTILYYHKISNENEDTAVSAETFQAQMQYLKDNGYTTQTLSGLLLKPAPPPA